MNILLYICILQFWFFVDITYWSNRSDLGVYISGQGIFFNPSPIQNPKCGGWLYPVFCQAIPKRYIGSCINVYKRCSVGIVVVYIRSLLGSLASQKTTSSRQSPNRSALTFGVRFVPLQCIAPGNVWIVTALFPFHLERFVPFSISSCKSPSQYTRKLMPGLALIYDPTLVGQVITKSNNN